jgi:hypothetical protein
MKDSGTPYSGKYDFIKTEMSWPITHMVAPKDKALGCVECHSAKDGRLAGIHGVYLPAATTTSWSTPPAGAIVLLTLLGVIGHGAAAHRHAPQELRSNKMSERVYLFKRFERFWHWSQAALIIFLMLTGLRHPRHLCHLRLRKGRGYHTTAAWTLIGLWVFAIFWHFTTGEWKQYIPTTEKVLAIMKYYLVGIFKHAPHPFKLTTLRKAQPAATPDLPGDPDLRTPCCGPAAGCICSTPTGPPGD